MFVYKYCPYGAFGFSLVLLILITVFTGDYMNALTLKNSQNRKIDFFSAFMLVMIFLSSMNFLGKFSYFIFAGFAVFFFAKYSRIKLNLTFFLIVFLAFSLILFDYTLNSGIAYLRQLILPLSYMIGFNFLAVDREENGSNTSFFQNRFLVMTLFISLGIFVHIFLNFYANLGSDDRTITDFWLSSSSSATCTASLFCFGIGMVPAILLNKTNRLLKAFAIVFLVICTVFALTLAVRTFFVLFVITFLFVFLYFSFSAERNGKVLKTVLIVSLVIFLLVVAYQKNLFGIKDGFENSNFFDRFFGKNSTIAIDEDSRLSNKSRYFAIMGNFPWGGGHISDELNGAYAHELYLDTYNRAGIIPYILLIVFVFGSTFRAIRLVARKELPVFTNCLILGLFLSINIEFLIEPIMEGVPWLLPLFCILCGMTDYMVNYEPMDSIKY